VVLEALLLYHLTCLCWHMYINLYTHGFSYVCHVVRETEIVCEEVQVHLGLYSCLGLCVISCCNGIDEPLRA
jgi:hypothetical protein